MGTFPEITQNGGSQTYTLAGQNITSHEVFAFNLLGGEPNAGALISNVTVYLNQDHAPGLTSYNVTLTVVDQNGNPSNGIVSGSFESTGV